jgi:hypothetical protein
MKCQDAIDFKGIEPDVHRQHEFLHNRKHTHYRRQIKNNRSNYYAVYSLFVIERIEEQLLTIYPI